MCLHSTTKKKNRGQKIYSSPVQQYAERSNLKLRSPSDLNEKEYQYIKNLKPQIVIVVAYGKILPKKILDLNNVEFLNIHASTTSPGMASFTKTTSSSNRATPLPSEAASIISRLAV